MCVCVTNWCCCFELWLIKLRCQWIYFCIYYIYTCTGIEDSNECPLSGCLFGRFLHLQATHYDLYYYPLCIFQWLCSLCSFLDSLSLSFQPFIALDFKLCSGFYRVPFHVCSNSNHLFKDTWTSWFNYFILSYPLSSSSYSFVLVCSTIRLVESFCASPLLLVFNASFHFVGGLSHTSWRFVYANQNQVWFAVGW